MIEDSKLRNLLLPKKFIPAKMLTACFFFYFNRLDDFNFKNSGNFNTNCLMKNLHKSESLPHIRNLHEKITQLSSVNREAGGRNEVNDEGEEETNGCDGP